MHQYHYVLRVRDVYIISFTHPLTVMIVHSSNSITSLSFSHDGEYLAIASHGSYVDLVGSLLDTNSARLTSRKCAVETGLRLHRIQSIGPSPTVTWHPSKYILAYCGQQIREGAPHIAYLSVYGPGI